ncbi:MAG: C39 family peptidase, partial [Chloroflexota bacterium]
AEVHLTNVRHEYQGWNNCGPTTVAMLLSHYGYSDTQNQTAPILKPNANDKNVGPDELAAYVRTKPNLDALTLINGNEQMLKQLIANGFPVIVETWFTPKPNDGMGHYRLLVGYSDTQKKFSALDSYNGPNVTLGYDDFDADWKAFNRTLVIGFPRAQSPVVNAITGYANDEALWRIAAERASAEIAANGNDAFAWYNLGSSQSALGQHESATKAFDRARRIGLPWRMLWYQFAIFDTYLAVGRTQDVLDLTAANLKQASDLEESHYYRGRALEALGKNDEAIKEYREALRLNKNYEAAAKALRSVGG